MRTHGTIIRWNSERGFGFVRPAGKDDEVFVHISEFGRGEPPQIGELISFEVIDHQGKPRAVNVQRTGASNKARQRGDARHARKPRREGLLRRGLGVAALVAIAVALLGPRLGLVGGPPAFAPDPISATAAAAPVRTDASSTAYRCDGRAHCSQMSSCAEATWVLRNCPNTQMDGDGDGVPCETQWCR